MAKREKKETFRTSIGGQALIEGILMRGPEKQAIVVRAPEGLVTKVEVYEGQPLCKVCLLYTSPSPRDCS